MANLLLKMATIPILLIIADLLLTTVNYPAIWQPVVLGIILAFVGHSLELLLLARGTFWISNIVDFISMFAIIYFGSMMFYMSYVTPFGALIAALFITIAEYAVHLWLIRSGRVTNMGYR